MTQRSNSAGRTVYGSGSFAPTRGPVSGQGNQGYLKRTLAQRAKKRNVQQQGVSKIGGDGQSDTRSGLAAVAANRAMGGNNGQPINATGRPVVQAQQASQPAQQAQPQQAQGPAQAGGSPAQQPAQAPQTAPAPTPQPHVEVNPDGTLKLGGLPYSGEFADEFFNLYRDRDDLLYERESTMNNARNKYDEQNRLMMEEYTRNMTQHSVNSSGVGLLHSSAKAKGDRLLTEDKVSRETSLLAELNSTVNNAQNEYERLFNRNKQDEGILNNNYQKWRQENTAGTGTAGVAPGNGPKKAPEPGTAAHDKQEKEAHAKQSAAADAAAKKAAKERQERERRRQQRQVAQAKKDGVKNIKTASVVSVGGKKTNQQKQKNKTAAQRRRERAKKANKK